MSAIFYLLNFLLCFAILQKKTPHRGSAECAVKLIRLFHMATPDVIFILALIFVSATPGYFFQTGRNSLSLKQPAALPKTPWRGIPPVGNLPKQ
jgi:hypothetical protein